MKIKILKIVNENTVEFSSRYGSGIALCKKAKGLKEENEYGAEVDINAQISLNVNASIAPKGEYIIRHSENVNEIQGFVDGIDEDGLIYLRFGQDCLIMVDADYGGCPRRGIHKGDWLLLTVNVSEM